MTLMGFLLLLVIAGICGSVAQSLVGYSHGGCLASIVVGFIGALLGRWIAGKLMLPEFFVLNVGGTAFPVIWSIIGAIVFTGVLSLLFKRGRA